MDHILSFWEGQAAKHGGSSHASWADDYMVDLERSFLAQFISDLSPRNALDCGTSNGHSLLSLAERFPSVNFEAFDYSPEMISQANLALQQSSCKNISRISLQDIRSTDYPSDGFDFVYTTRVLINLATWQEQVLGTKECLRLVRPGGSLLLMEAFWEPLCKLNSFRALGGLAPLEEHDFNRYLKHSNLSGLLIKMGVKYSTYDFSSTYYFLTRFVRELIHADEADSTYKSKFNHYAKELHLSLKPSEGLGVQQAYLIHKPQAS